MVVASRIGAPIPHLDAYLAQQLYCYPPDYLSESCPPERLLETVERFEEDLTDVARVHRPLRVVIHVAPAIEVSPTRERGGAEDPVMRKVRESHDELLQKSAGER